MRDAMKAANRAKRFARIRFDAISLHSENRHEIAYKKPSDVIISVISELEYLRDKKNTELALKSID